MEYIFPCLPVFVQSTVLVLYILTFIQHNGGHLSTISVDTRHCFFEFSPQCSFRTVMLPIAPELCYHRSLMS